jgi:uncharacterized protein (TIGR02145 family)
MRLKIMILITQFIGLQCLSYSQVIEVTHQSNGTVLAVPIESIDSVKFQLIPPPALKKIYQNNGNVLGLSLDDIDSITYNIPNSIDLPVLSTSQTTVLSPTTAFGGGTIGAEGSSPVLQRGVCWSTNPNPTTANSHTIDGSGLGTYNSSIYPLSPSTTYYTRAYATNSSGTAYGNNITITTTNPSSVGSIPTVITSNVSYTDGLTANCGGSIVADGGLAIMAKGVCWAIGTTPTINNNFTIDGTGAGSFSSVLINLLPNTSYFVRAYATNDAGTAYGITYSYTTNTLPTVFTDSVSNVTTGSGSITGTVQSSASSPIIARGICWSFNPQPTLNDNVIPSGTGNGSFNKNIIGLLNLTTCYVRAYATNGVGTSYGSVLSFTTNTFAASVGAGVSFDGYNYQTVVYGNGQEWMAENLRTTQYANGNLIENITDSSVWSNTTIGAWAYFGNNIMYNNPYGKLYNNYAVTDTRNICPSGWHVPTLNDWDLLIYYLGGYGDAGAKMNSTIQSNWSGGNSWATNESLFSAVPAGMRDGYVWPAGFYQLGLIGYYWSSTASGTAANSIRVFNNSISVNGYPSFGQQYWNQQDDGLSVRCVKN